MGGSYQLFLGGHPPSPQLTLEVAAGSGALSFSANLTLASLRTPEDAEAVLMVALGRESATFHFERKGVAQTCRAAFDARGEVLTLECGVRGKEDPCVTLTLPPLATEYVCKFATILVAKSAGGELPAEWDEVPLPRPGVAPELSAVAQRFALGEDCPAVAELVALRDGTSVIQTTSVVEFCPPEGRTPFLTFRGRITQPFSDRERTAVAGELEALRDGRQREGGGWFLFLNIMRGELAAWGSPPERSLVFGDTRGGARVCLKTLSP